MEVSRSYSVASVSWGKDSTAMLMYLLDNEECDLREVVFYDTGAEFNAIYNTRDKMLPWLKSTHVKYTELHPREPFFYSMLARPVRSRKTGEVHKHGYGWCGGRCRWGTSAKQSSLDSYCRKVGATTVYVGIAADELDRIKDDGWKRYPLVEAGLTEQDCLRWCLRCGYDWKEGDVSLYDVLDRVSCWCCRNKNLKELRAMHDMLPTYYEKLIALEDVIGEPMKKNHTLRELAGDDK